jgi:hypothetical protein
MILEARAFHIVPRRIEDFLMACVSMANREARRARMLADEPWPISTPSAA